MQRVLERSCPLRKDKANDFCKIIITLLLHPISRNRLETHFLRQVESDICVFIVPHVCKTLQIYEKPYDLCTEIMMKHIKTSGVINEGICSGEYGSSFLPMFIDFLKKSNKPTQLVRQGSNNNNNMRLEILVINH